MIRRVKRILLPIGLALPWLVSAQTMVPHPAALDLARPALSASVSADHFRPLGKITFRSGASLLAQPPEAMRIDFPDSGRASSRTGFPWFAPQEESPYKINFRKGGPVVGVGAGLFGASIIILNNQKPLSLDELQHLNRNNVWAFDRGATYEYSRTAGKISDGLLLSSIAMPWLYLTQPKTRRDFGRIVIMQFETGLVAYGLVALTKSVTNRVRPFAYNPAAPLNDKLTINAKDSFFSGHTSVSAAMAFFMATTFSQYYPESPLKPWVWTYAVVWPAAAGYMRYRAGSHFPTDVITGYIVGAASGVIIPKIHQKFLRKKERKPAY